MNIAEEYVFYIPNIENNDEIFDKASSDCSYKYFHSYKSRKK